MRNEEVAKLLFQIADILDFQGVAFKPAAYRRAAQAVENLDEDIEILWHNQKLAEIDGFGKAITEKVSEFLETGKLAYIDKLQKGLKVDVIELGKIPNLGPRKIKVLYEKLKVKNIQDLEKVIQKKKVRELEGFGEKSEEVLLKGIEHLKRDVQRFPLNEVAPIVKKVLKRLTALKEVQKAEVAGSFRRHKETVGDLDFLVVSEDPNKVMNAFATMANVQEILARGMTKTSVRLANGLQMDLRVVKEKEYGSALLYFTGSKFHNVRLRKLALKKGLTLNEYGLFTLKDKTWVAGRTEEEIYTLLDLPFIAPEKRIK